MPGNRAYKNGREKEYRVRKKLLEEGWQIVVRSAGSHSPIDLIAIKPPGNGDEGEILLVQCKGGASAPYERVKAFEQIKHLGGQYQVAVSVL